MILFEMDIIKQKNKGVLKMIKTRKVALVGTGFVGMSMVYALLNRGTVDEIVLIDIAKDKTVGEAMDISHGIPFTAGDMKVKAGEYDDCKDADVVVITAGVPQKPGQTRLELAKTNTKIMEDITKSVMASGFDGIFVIASNPVDLMSYVVQKVSKLPKERVIGSGTLLDTARLRYMLAERLHVSSKDVHAYIMGEHGDSSFFPWSHAYIGCKSLTKWYQEKGMDVNELEKIHEEVVQAAYEIINKKRATYYGIGVSLSRLVEAIFRDENAILPVSTLINGEYGNEGIYIGVPAIIGKDGLKEIVQIELNEQEQEKFNHSVQTLKDMLHSEIEPLLNA